MVAFSRSVLFSCLLLSACGEANHEFLPPFDTIPPPASRMKPLVRTEKTHSDLYLAADTEVGLYKAPTWIGVYSTIGITDLTGASYIWKSGLKWFDNINWNANPIGGQYTEWVTSYIEVIVILANKETVTLTGYLDKQTGCWTDWENWVAPSYVDQYNVTWPETKLIFDWPVMQLQSLVYKVPGTSCNTRTYSMRYMIWCEGISGTLGTTREWYPWPSEPGCVPANEHAMGWLYFRGAEGTMHLVLEDHIDQVFYGTPVTPPAQLKLDSAVTKIEVDDESEENTDAEEEKRNQ